MRYELGVLQCLVASSAGRNRDARLDVVARTLGKSVGDLDDALRYLRLRGFVDAHGQPTEAGRARARFLQGPAPHESTHRISTSRSVPRPSRIPSASGVYESVASVVPAKVKKVG